ncbi:MAG TPA: 1-(5-phosphoribosyl)-5-[(5-phosphoribosylamino)methylideneamino] imidazole-4-carboxamide isomerase [Candidatus Limnocylindria bacterium]|nr:1-(5-phosphoribosyl)-5-[(5-phosphoribosylamino)methylideneamino] imidazole-4-carboxamide isomerase [Candidatus Limnocylindria bacterium]
MLPAIDLVGGRVVRLRQGDFERMDVYGDDPLQRATAFAAAGARWLHIVDLDGARSGRRRHAAVIAEIVDALGADVACEVGGGLRTEASVESVLASGARRAVLGTRALKDPGMIGRLVGRHGAHRIVVAIDVRDGRAVGDGWLEGAGGKPIREAFERLMDAGVAVFEVTGIQRDGLLAGPDLELLASAVASGAQVIASGGIRSVGDLRAVRAIGCAGAIVGRALYDGSLDLADALAATR